MATRAAAYAEAYPSALNSRTRGRVALENTSFMRAPRAGGSGTAIPTDLLLSLVLSKSLLVIALHIARDWLLGNGLSAFALWSGYLVVGAPAVLVFQASWTGSKGKGVVRRQVLQITLSPAAPEPAPVRWIASGRHARLLPGAVAAVRLAVR